MIVNQANLQNLFVAFRASFNEGFRNAQPQWDRVATRVPSNTRENHYAWLGQWPRLREWVGDRVIRQMQAHDYRIVNKDYESTVAVGRNDIADDQHGIYTPIFQEEGFAAATHPDELVFSLLADGFNQLAYDGQNFFDTDHPVGREGDVESVSNMQAGAGNPWFLLDTSRSLRPLIFQERQGYELTRMDDPRDENVFMRKEFLYGVDARVNVGFGFWQMAFGSQDVLNTSNFNAAWSAMRAFKSDEGRPLGIRPNLLVHGPSNRAAAHEVIKAERRGNGETNTNRDAVELLEVAWLD